MRHRGGVEHSLVGKRVILINSCVTDTLLIIAGPSHDVVVLFIFFVLSCLLSLIIYSSMKAHPDLIILRGNQCS